MSGGGVAGAAHIGFLMGLQERGIRPRVLVGTSAGGIVAGFLAAGYTLPRLEQVFAEVSAHPAWYGLVDEAENWILHHTLREERGGLIDLAGLFARLLHGHQMAVADWSVGYGVTATDLLTGTTVLIARPGTRAALGRSLTTVEAVTATSALPGLFCGVQTSDAFLVDGGVLDDSPYDSVQTLAEQQGIALDLILYLELRPQRGPLRPTPTEVVARTIDLLLAKANAERPTRTPVVHLRPELPAGAGLFSFALYPQLLAAGQRSARDWRPPASAKP